MDTFVQTHEAAIRLGSFVGIFAVMALWEVLAPRRGLTISKAVRWVNNLGLAVLNTVLLRLLLSVISIIEGPVFKEIEGLTGRGMLPAPASVPA